jgi:hypothetical protein
MPESPHDPSEDHDVFYDGPAPDAPPPPPPSGSAAAAADLLVSALLEVGPEAADHLFKAAQELLLAAKAVVDAGERVVERHLAETDEGDDPAKGDEPRVRRIDLA